MPDLSTIIAADHAHYMNTFGERIPLCFTHGQGATLYDQNGKAYTDFLAGIAVNALGYGDEGFLSAITEQAKKLIHCSNYFYIESQAMLAQALCESTCADRVFFANSGAEANEGALKLARRYFYSQGKPRAGVVSALHSFHGRTFATLAATGQEKYRAPFVPLVPGFVNVPYNDLSAMEEAVDETTCAVLVECIQGEGGVIPAEKEYLQGLRALCDRTGALLIFDEVQTGMGRTGRLFAHQAYGVEPDIFTSAKALGGGLPIGAVLAREKYCAFVPGDHGTTFGGNPLCCAAGLYVLGAVTQPGFLEAVDAKGKKLFTALSALKGRCEAILDVRGMGLMLGVQLSDSLPVGKAAAALREKGFLAGTAGQNTLRLVPPLTIGEEELLSIVPALEAVLNG